MDEDKRTRYTEDGNGIQAKQGTCHCQTFFDNRIAPILTFKKVRYLYD